MKNMHPASLANLEKRKLIQKGEVRNPKGIKNTSLVNIIKRYADKFVKDSSGKESGISYLEGSAIALYKAALKGDTKAIAIILDRIDGPVPKDIKLEHKGPIKITFDMTAG